MTSHFFGQFLLDLGEIDEGQLEQALASIDEVDLSIGQLALRGGHLDQAQVDRIQTTQQGHPELFGQLALVLGLLDSKTLDGLLEEQRATHLYIGDALMRNGALSAMKLAELLDRFKESEGRPPAPRIPVDLRDHLLAITTLELLPRIALRVAHVKLKVLAIRIGSVRRTYPTVCRWTLRPEAVRSRSACQSPRSSAWSSRVACSAVQKSSSTRTTSKTHWASF